MSKTPESLDALPVHERPRERLIRSGAAALSDAELLALVLGSGRPGRSVVASARMLLAQVGGFGNLVVMDAGQLQKLFGVGPATAGRLVAASEIWRRANAPTTASQLTDSAAIARVMLPELMHRQTERFLLVVADRALRVRDVVLLCEGNDHTVHVAVGDVLKAVLSRGGAAFAVAHNHPGGVLRASEADVAITERLRVAAAIVGLRFLDHIIVAGGDWRSIA